MALETGDFINDLVITNPLGTDPKSKGDDHIRLLKKTVQQSFPNIDAEVDLTSAQLNGFTGMVAAFPLQVAGNVSGWITCSGQAVSRTGFANLFAFLGVAYGVGDGTTTFNVPDYRGKFLRAQDNGASIDPDAATRTARADGVTGDQPGTEQLDEFKSHDHQMLTTLLAATGTARRISDSSGDATNNQMNFSGGNETRPINVNVIYHIHT